MNIVVAIIFLCIFIVQAIILQGINNKFQEIIDRLPNNEALKNLADKLHTSSESLKNAINQQTKGK